MSLRLGFWMAIMLLPLGLASGVSAREKLNVVATFSILGDMVARVGGDRVTAETLVGPGEDTHVFQPTPAAAAKLARAHLVVQNGLRFEGWIEKMIQSSGFTGPIVTATKGVRSIGARDHHGSHDHGHGGKVDPHAWHDLANAAIYVTNIKDGLCKLDFDGCPIYTANAAHFITEITRLDGEIKVLMDAVPRAARSVVTSHDAFGYFSRAYGIRFLSPRGFSTESEASAKDVARLIDQIRREQVKALFVENITDPRLIEQIARETGVEPGATLYSGALSRRSGPAATYLDMMWHNARSIAGAMAGP